jgi:hypothetical protein
MGKGHRIQVRKDFIRLIYAKNMSRRYEKAVRSSELYAEMVRLCGVDETERLLDEAPRAWRNTAWPPSSKPCLKIISRPTGGCIS